MENKVKVVRNGVVMKGEPVDATKRIVDDLKYILAVETSKYKELASRTSEPLSANEIKSVSSLAKIAMDIAGSERADDKLAALGELTNLSTEQIINKLKELESSD